jgi:hypothetical protein
VIVKSSITNIMTINMVRTVVIPRFAMKDISITCTTAIFIIHTEIMLMNMYYR